MAHDRDGKQARGLVGTKCWIEESETVRYGTTSIKEDIPQGYGHLGSSHDHLEEQSIAKTEHMDFLQI
jgi:hypothetical protein